MFEALKARLQKSEGVVPYMYLDTRGNVTVGIGHLLATSAHAEALAFEHKVSRKPATVADVRAEYSIVKALTPDKPARFYAIFATLWLPDAVIDELQERDIQAKAAELSSRLPAFANYPAPAQEALLDMAFNLGTGGLIEKFPRMLEAVRMRNWLLAAAYCPRVGVRESRNVETAALFKQASEVRA